MKNSYLLLMLATVAISGSALLDQAGAQYFYGGRGYGYSSTAEEGFMRGMGDLTRARGEKNLMNSEAAKNMTDVRSADLDNKVKTTETYWERKRINKENRFYSDEQKAAIRQKNLEKQMFYRAKQSQGRRPDAGKLDPVSGSIDWPIALGNPAYDKYRAELDELFAERADKQGAIGYEGYTRITRLTKSMLKTLKDQLRSTDMSQRDYTDSKKFIESLAVEARHTSA